MQTFIKHMLLSYFYNYIFYRYNIWGEKEHMLHEEIKLLKRQPTFDTIKLEAFIDKVKSCVTEVFLILQMANE